MNFIYSIAFGVAAYILYRVNKHWLTIRKKNNDPEAITKLQGIQTWIFIIVLIMLSVICLFV